MKPYFIAYFDDGFVIQQDPENDVSIKNPHASKFYDVGHYIGTNQIGLNRFELHIAEDLVFEVDLKTGHFKLNGVEFRAEDKEHIDSLDIAPFTLIYYLDQTVTYEVDRQTSHKHTRYRLGWKNKNRTQCIIVG